MTRYGFTRLTKGMNQYSTPQPALVGTRSRAASRGFECTRYCQAGHAPYVITETISETHWKMSKPSGPSTVPWSEIENVSAVPAVSRVTTNATAIACTPATSTSAIVTARANEAGSR